MELFQLMIQYFSDHFLRLVSFEIHRAVCLFHRRLSMVNEHVLLVEQNSAKMMSRSMNDEIGLLVNMY